MRETENRVDERAQAHTCLTLCTMRETVSPPQKKIWNKHAMLLHWIGLQIQQEPGMVGRPKPAMRRRLRRVKRANARCDMPCVVWVGEKSRIYAV